MRLFFYGRAECTIRLPVKVSAISKSSNRNDQASHLEFSTGQPARTPANLRWCGIRNAIINIQFNREYIMKIEEVRSIAKAHHIKTAHLSKSELIRSIQSDEGNFDCFGTAIGGECDQVNCIWREDCFGAAREMMLS
jgi:hypothetical protein